MENIDFGIEISEEVKNTETPDKIERYDLVPQKEVEVIEMERIFSDYRHQMGKDWTGGDDDV